jgi:hypothetical protein
MLMTKMWSFVNMENDFDVKFYFSASDFLEFSFNFVTIKNLL